MALLVNGESYRSYSISIHAADDVSSRITLWTNASYCASFEDITERSAVLCQTWETHIKNATGFEVTIVPKTHLNFCDLISHKCTTKRKVSYHM